MNNNLNWNLVEDTLEQLLREDGTFDQRFESPSNPAPGIRSSYGPCFMRTESSFANVAGQTEGGLALKILAFAEHPQYGMVMVPMLISDFGKFEEIVTLGITEQFHLHYLALAGCLTSSPHTTLLKFSLESAAGVQRWMAHSGKPIIYADDQKRLYDLVDAAAIETQLIGAIAPTMPPAPYHRCYISGGMNEDGTLRAEVLLDDQALPEAESQLEALVRPIFTEFASPGLFRRFLLFAPGTPVSD